MSSKIFCLALGTFVLGTDAFIVAGILPKLARDFDVSVAVAAQAVTAFSLVYAIGAPIFATLLGSVPRRPLLLAVMALFVVANVASMRSTTFGALIASRVIAAAAASVYSPIATASAAALSAPAMRGRAIATVTGGLAVATVLGVPLGTWIGTLYSWRATFLFVAELGVLAMALLMIALPSLPPAPVVSLRTRASVWTRGEVLMSLAVTAAAMTGVFTVYTFLVPILHHVTVLGERGTGLVLLVYGLGTVIGTAVGGVGTDRFGAHRTLTFAIFGLLVSLPVFSALALARPSVATTAFACLAVLVWGAVGWAYNPAQSQRLLSLDAKVGPLTLSANGSAIHLGIGLGSMLGGVLIHRFSTVALGAAGGALQLLALLALSWSVRLFARRSTRTSRKESSHAIDHGPRRSTASHAVSSSLRGGSAGVRATVVRCEPPALAHARGG